MTPDEKLALVYTALKARRDANPTVRELPKDARRRYAADAVRAYRERQKQALEKGSPEPTKANVRHALADAAIAILATNSAGSDEIKNALRTIFKDKPGVPMSVEQHARSGKLRTKLLKVGVDY